MRKVQGDKAMKKARPLSAAPVQDCKPEW